MFKASLPRAILEIAQEGKIQFLDMLVERLPDASLRKLVYRKPTHKNLYLHNQSHQNPASVMSVADVELEKLRGVYFVPKMGNEEDVI